MKNIFNILISVFLFTYLNSQSNTIQYISPLPGSNYNSESTNLIIGYTGKLNSDDIKSSQIKVTGSLSGIHTGKIVFAESNTKILFIPDKKFEAGEKVTVNMVRDKFSYYFYISKGKITFPDYLFSEGTVKKKDLNNYDFLNGDTVPNITITINGPTAPGYIFIANFLNSGIQTASTLMMLNNNASPVFARDLLRRAYDFDKQNDNLLTYYNEVRRKFYGLNRNYQIVDSFWCQNGYSTDLHELRVLSNGSAWLMSYDPQRVDMSVIVPGGNPNALVTGLVIQKIDANKNVLFQWRSWDHFQITDATHENLLDDTIDYVHGNSIDVDTDNNIIISCRHMDEITKINTANGNIIWRLGGKNNQFTFLNDTVGFSHQHDARRISNGHLTLFDNGNYHIPHFSRAIEYSLNESSPKTATIVWQYRRTPSVYSSAMGNVQRLPNGNTLIGWGISSSIVSLTEVTSAGNIMYELSLPSTMSSYRAFRYEWSPLVGINPVKNELPSKFRLYQNYPNPFNPTTNIKYQVSKSGYVTLKVYDVLGKEVATLVNGFQNPGEYKVQFPDNKNTFAQLQSGIYFYKLQTENFTDVKKMVLIK